MADPFVRFPTVERTGFADFPLRIAWTEGDGIALSLEQAEVVFAQLRQVMPGLRAEARDTPPAPVVDS